MPSSPPPRSISSGFPNKSFFRTIAYSVPFGLFALAFFANLPPVGRIVLGVEALVLSGVMTAIWRWLFADTLDTVEWRGDELLLTYNGEEDRIAVRDIVKVENLRGANPERIKLTLSVPCLFGSEVQFFPTFRAFASKPHPIMEELLAAASGSMTSNGAQ
jgi:hypothetical protein